MAAQALQWHSLTDGPEGLEAFERGWSTVLTLPNSQEQRQRPQEPGDLRTALCTLLWMLSCLGLRDARTFEATPARAHSSLASNNDCH